MIDNKNINLSLDLFLFKKICVTSNKETALMINNRKESKWKKKESRKNIKIIKPTYNLLLNSKFSLNRFVIIYNFT